MNRIILKLKEVILSVLPIVVIVFVLNLTIAPMESHIMWRFVIGSVFVVIGLTIFLLGVDIGITPLGGLTGKTLAKSNKLWMVLIGGLILGFFISVAEPGLMVLAEQIEAITSGEVTKGVLLVTVSLGLAVMLAVGFLRIFYNKSLYKVLIVLYGLIFIMAIFSSKEFFAIAFDASGATTGVLAVPFILALSVGISSLKRDSRASEKDSFGLVAIASTGAVISVLCLDLVRDTENLAPNPPMAVGGTESVISHFVEMTPLYFKESLLAILPLVVIMLIMEKLSFKLKKRAFRKLIIGFIFAFVGLTIFLVGVNGGFMELGSELGCSLAGLNSKGYIIAVGFILGIVTILAEPAVYILTHQIEDVTSGYIKSKAVLIPLALGVGLAVALSVIRITFGGIELWYFIVPGYAICLILTLFIPKLFVGIAFDAGGVATGPMTATFILAFMQGTVKATEGANAAVDGFGMISMVALLPIVTLEILGWIFAVKAKKRSVKKKHG